MADFNDSFIEVEMKNKSALAWLPSVEKVLEDKRIAGHVTRLARKGIIRLIREEIASCRERLHDGTLGAPGRDDLREKICRAVSVKLDELSRNLQRRVINATGVVLHTNLGRAVLGTRTCEAVEKAASGCVDIEIDIVSGERVERGRRARRLLRLLTGAEDAFIVNNNAAAVLLAVSTLAGDGVVAISRGELVEIGGSFRLPEILSIAADRVAEVGTTNRTHLKDYERAIREGADLLLKVHTSNYKIVGYTNDVSVRELVELGKANNVPVMYDQGSGVLYPLGSEGIGGEECIEELVETGVDIISFSADKVLGAPQGGILLASAHLIGRMRSNHLSRALRTDKLTMAGLEQVLLHYWLGEYDHIPALQMILADGTTLRKRAERFTRLLDVESFQGVDVSVVEGESSIGGGSFPINPLRTFLVVITLPAGVSDTLSGTLRKGDPAVLVRVKGNAVFLDLRTVARHDEKTLAEKLRAGIGTSFERK